MIAATAVATQLGTIIQYNTTQRPGLLQHAEHHQDIITVIVPPDGADRSQSKLWTDTAPARGGPPDEHAHTPSIGGPLERLTRPGLNLPVQRATPPVAAGQTLLST